MVHINVLQVKNNGNFDLPRAKFEISIDLVGTYLKY